MTFDDIYRFFESPPPIYLNKELAVCYTLATLLQADSYGTALIQHLGGVRPDLRLSDTVLYSALKFLEEEGAIAGYWQKVEGRGRPRRMYHLCPETQLQARQLADLWERYLMQPVSQPLLTPRRQAWVSSS